MVVLWSTLGQAPARADRGSEPSTPVRAARRRPDESQNGLVTAYQRDRLEVTPALADHVPPRPELVPVLPVLRSGLLVAGIAVQRLSAVGDLELTVGPLDLADELRVQPGTGLDRSYDCAIVKILCATSHTTI